MTNDSAVQIKIPEQLIEDLMRTEIVKHLGNKEEFAEAVVRQALQTKSNHYDRKTVFQESVESMIREECKAILKEWIDANREMLREKLMAHLNKGKQKKLKDLCESICQQVGKFDVAMRVTFKDQEWE